MPEFDSTTEYRDVIGFPGYKVGSDGSIWSCRTKISLGNRKGMRSAMSDTWRRLKPQLNPSGHLHIHLCPGRHTRLMHRLVLEAFVGPCPEGMEACHAPDRSPANNSLLNLRWDTHTSNGADAVRDGTTLTGSRNRHAKLTEAQVAEIRAKHAMLPRYGAMKRLAAEYGISCHSVHRIVTRSGWKHVA